MSSLSREGAATALKDLARSSVTLQLVYTTMDLSVRVACSSDARSQ
jgi:hypothetical protein